MAHESLARNPFMLMTNPEVVLAAIERSERLGQLNRHLCRPLDRPIANAQNVAARDAVDANDESDANDRDDESDLTD